MKNKIITLLVFAAIILNGQTEPVILKRCATPVPDKAWDDWFNAKVDEFKKNNPLQKNQSSNYTIPVVFHVIHGGQAVGAFPNLLQAQINSQIPILNADYGGTGFNVSHFSNTSFSSSLIANCSITFCLAEKDPGGIVLAEKGIDRVNYITKGWASPSSFTTQTDFSGFIDNTLKPNTIWDATRYLNIWLSDVNSSVGLLGYSTFPPASGLVGIPSGPGTLTTDGVWCYAAAIGDVGTLASVYNKGRTVTHEIGHYLGLRHIWGDSNCGTDYCNDTPIQQTSNLTCPTYPSPTCSNAPNGDLFMNFMDYCYDACLYMFTNDQHTRMQTAMTNSPLRIQLSASAATLCSAAPVGIKENSGLNNKVDIFPNPSNGNFTITMNLPSSQNINVTVYTVLGESVIHEITNGSKQNNLEIKMDNKPSGIYFLEINTGQEKIVKRLIVER